MKKMLLVMAMTMSTLVSFSQNSNDSDLSPETTYAASASLGIGAGLDYGGIGVKLSGALSDPFAVFAAFGYNFNGMGFNGGVTVRLMPHKRVCPTLTAMYGYNAVLIIEDYYGNETFSKTYYGPTFGAGVEFHSKRRVNNYFNLELLVPIRSQEYQDIVDVVTDSKLPPIGLAFGYHFGRGNKNSK